MIRARLRSGTIVLGLSRLNVERMQAGKPMHFSLSDLGIDTDVLIVFGETEQTIAASLGVPAENTNLRKPS